MAGYKGFEDETLSHRLAKGKANYWRLATILHGKHALTARTRMQLWRSCVWTSVSYGLDCRNHCAQASAGCLILPFSHHTCEQPRPDAEVQHGSPTEYAACADGQNCAACCRVLRRLTLKPSCVKPVQQDAEVAVCPECGVTYASRKAMLVHASRAHKITISQTCARKFNRLTDAMPGDHNARIVMCHSLRTKASKDT